MERFEVFGNITKNDAIFYINVCHLFEIEIFYTGYNLFCLHDFYAEKITYLAVISNQKFFPEIMKQEENYRNFHYLCGCLTASLV